MLKVIFLGDVYIYRSSPLEIISGKGVLKISIKFTEEHPCDLNKVITYFEKKIIEVII